MKSTAFMIALLGSSAVTALEPRDMKRATTGTEVVMTRTVTVTTFQEAGPTNSNVLSDRDVRRSKGSGRKGGPHRGRPSASPLEHMPGFHGAASEVPEPTKEAINARAPIPVVVVPTPSASSAAGKPIAGNGAQGHAAPGGHRPGNKAHNGTFNLLHVMNHTADDRKGKHHDKAGDLQDWIKKVEDTASSKAKDVEDSALSKAQDILD